LQPETYEAFIGQRSRWCQGMFQLFLMKNPVFKPGLKVIQRLAYLSSMTYWFFPLPRMIFMFAPLLHIFFDVKLFISTVEESIAYAATYVIVNTMIQNELYGHVRWPWMSELYEYVQGVYLVKAIAAVVASPGKPTFNVTAKGLSLENDHLSGMAWPFIISFILLLLGVVTAAWRYAFEPGVNSIMLVVGLWALFNLSIAGAALGVVAERRELRRHPRLAVARRGRISFDGYSADAAIENVSAGGCAIRVPAAAVIGNALHGGKARGRLTIRRADGGVEMQTLDVVRMRVERDGNTLIIGLKFDALTPSVYPVLADLMYGDAQALAKFLAGRRKHMGIVRGTLVFLRWSACEPVRAFYCLFARWHRSGVARFMTGAPAVTSVSRTGVAVDPVGMRTDRAIGARAPLLIESPPISPDASEGDAGFMQPPIPGFGYADPLLVPRA
jgi:cellulose synthase (UDP-forming)